MSKTKVIKSVFVPRPHQAEFMTNRSLYSVLLTHRRFGKTVLAVGTLYHDGMVCPMLNPQFAFISPTKKQTKRNAWRYFKWLGHNIPGIVFFESELKVEFPNATGSITTIYLEGADDPDTFRGMYLDGVVMDEVAQMPDGILEEVFMPAMMERKGWAILLGTPKGKNGFFRYYEKGVAKEDGIWSSHVYPVSKTKIFDETTLQRYRRQAGNAKYLQEYECSFEAIIEGSFYGETLENARNEGRIGYFPYNSSYPVITSWDLGSTNKTCVWFMQLINDKVYFIDYVEGSNKTIPYFIDLLKSKNYNYSVALMPHDVKQNPFSVGGKSRLQEFRDRGLKCRVVDKTSIEEGINASRTMLEVCYINEVPCKTGLEALFYYHCIKSEAGEAKPYKDWSSDPADAFRYAAVGLKPSMAKPYHLIKDPYEIRRLTQYESYNPLDIPNDW
jgi:phage terminase large subunit